MEPNATWSYTLAAQQASSVRAQAGGADALHANSPAIRHVLERLGEFLTPPQSLALQPTKAQRRSGAYDSMAAHCLAESHKPGPDMLWAYDACAAVIKRHSKSFYFSARLLPAHKRSSIMALYAFCRLSDDLVDEADEQGDLATAQERARVALDRWATVCSDGSDKAHPVVQAWCDTRRRFGIPRELPEELLAGIRMDLSISRYETWDDLWVYCYRVASTVGLMSMYITGTETMDAVPYAIQLGVALQLTNILRDVGEDARAGRVYIPSEDMERFGYTEDMLLSGVINSNFIKLMNFEIARAHALYASARAGIAMLPADSRLGVTAAAGIYQGILRKIEEARYDVFNRRAHLSTGEKLRALPGLWWRARQTRYTSR